MKQPAVYILASQRNGSLYIGVTSNLRQRIWQHQNDAVEGFTQRYHVHVLVYYETFDDMRAAIEREKQLKKMEPGVEVNVDRERESTMARSGGRFGLTRRGWWLYMPCHRNEVTFLDARFRGHDGFEGTGI